MWTRNVDGSSRDRDRLIRTREIEEWTNLVLVHPLSERFARFFARVSLHPNVVSVGGMVLGIAAGVAYHHVASTSAIVAGFLLMIGWHVMDGADGQLARFTGKTSEIGKVLDGLADHVAFAAVYVGLSTALAATYGADMWMIVVGAGLSHLVQSAAYEYQRCTYDYFAHGKASGHVPTQSEWKRRLREKRGAGRFFGVLYLAYLYVQFIGSGANGSTHVTVQRALRRTAEPVALRDIYRDVHRDAVRRWALLCSNYRTVAIFVFCLAGYPLYYFLYEIVVLNVALLLLTRMQRRRNAMLQERIADAFHEEAV